ncbi:endoribonuclease Dicer homolog 4 [Macadamia integrifolia]|uniref:endoribonuclease Dicer homolog 4 n=1 Tax=Macadamia integrifolia TaxID=60698 RepID=UPI001C4F93BF|nr:endoribonuclease Dicer homolog 4 [Macadamia integrifolia]
MAEDHCQEEEATSKGTTQTIELSVLNGEIPNSMVDDEVQTSSNVNKTAKDPRIIARKYQLDLCKKALEENVIVYLGTGSGKTHIAVLLIYELGHLIKKPQKNICVFLAPTIPLVRQQARVIEESTDFKVGSYYGSSKHLKTHAGWDKEIEQYEVLVMTPQILVHNLHHCFIKMDQIALLIFDECHHAQARSSHPYAQIMKEFYETGALKLPRIFGMTASPIVGKGASKEELPICINSLEKLLDAKVCSVSDKEELDSFVASPKVKVYDYGPVVNGFLSTSCVQRLEEIKGQCLSMLSMKADDRSRLQNSKRSLGKMHNNLIFCLENLGLWGTKQAIRIFLDGDNSERNELMGTEAGSSENLLADQYLATAASVLDSDLMEGGVGSDLSALVDLKEPFFSKKLLTLVDILSNFRLQPNMKCIVFVNRIIVARSLSCILQKLKCLATWKCDFLVGFHSGLKNMSRKIMNSIVEKFRSGELNLLVATKVGEEGLDIQTCCLVIRFDLPDTVASFIQSRGRARMPQSEYAFLVDRGNEKEMNLINSFLYDEDRMNKEIMCRTSRETIEELDDAIYKVDSTGASTSSNYSVSLLHRYCSQLPHDEYFNPMPAFFYYDDAEGILCHIILPSNAPIHKVVSAPQPSKDLSKRDACLKACQELHKVGALTDYLLPGQADEVEKQVLPSSNSESSEDESSRGELHEMLCPAALKVPWNNSENITILNFYFISFAPIPEDRLYQKFGLFVKAPLPREAERMEIDLHLDHGRIVRTELVPSGWIEFDKDEILLAENFQEMFLRIILDRTDFMSDFVPLGKNEKSQSRSLTFYLLLPVREHEHEDTMTIDWNIVRKCLSSPVFKLPSIAAEKGVLPVNQTLKLASGPADIADILNSLVFIPHKKSFFFIDGILPEINGYSPTKGYSSYKEYFMKRLGIHLLYPEQPFLKAKQLFLLHNLLHNRKQDNTVAHEKKEHFIQLPPEICQMKIIGFSKDIGSSVSLLPSIMHRLENLLVAIELKDMLSDSFPEGSEVTASRVLEALTTEKCSERFSLERLEVLGDAFLKYAVGRHLFLLYEALDEGELTRRRSNIVNNSHLYKLATSSNLQVYIRDQPFEPCRFFTFGRPCPIVCDKDTQAIIHCQQKSGSVATDGADVSDVMCNRCHHWLYKKTIADVVEALIGAFLVDSGFKAAIAFLRWIGIEVDFEVSQVSKICMASQGYMSLADSVDIAALENLLGYQFLHKGLLLQAFVHPSFNHPFGGCYQRLEFLGDAVLDYLITSYLYSVYPKLKPGELTDLRSVSVNNNSFARIAVSRSFHMHLISDSDSLSEAIAKFVTFVRTPASKNCLNEGPKCPKVLGDLVESCVGAVLLDTGFDLNHVWRLMLSFVDPIMSFSSLQFNPVREVQELCQHFNWELQFRSSETRDAFVVEAHVVGEDLPSSGSARNINKEAAKRMAAKQLLLKLTKLGYRQKNKTEKFLEANSKQEAKIIGYDESPINVVVPECIDLDALKMQDAPPARKHLSKTREVGMESSKTRENSGSTKNSQFPGVPCIGSAKSYLYEMCTINCWKAPAFECCNEEGPSHLKKFTFKVTVEMEEASRTVLECFGAPQPGKKAAAENAAEGALWYLKHQGYLPKDNTEASSS